MKDGLVSDSAEAPLPEKAPTATVDRGETSAAKGARGNVRLLLPVGGLLLFGGVLAAQYGNTAAEKAPEASQSSAPVPADMGPLANAQDPSSGAAPAADALVDGPQQSQDLSDDEVRRLEDQRRADIAAERERRAEERRMAEEARQRRLAEALAERQRRERAPVMVLAAGGTSARAAGGRPAGTASAPGPASSPRGRDIGRNGEGDEDRGGSGIARDLETSDIVRVSATTLPNRGFTIEAGTQIPCTLQTALDSTLSGLVSCILPYDVRSATGQVVLLEKGTRVLGEYRGGIQQGEARIFVVWNRAVSPRGVAVNLASPAADSLGRSGVDGEVENFFFKRFGGALLLSLVGDASTALANSIAGVDQTINAPNQATSEVLRNDLRIRPVLRAPQGSALTIIAARDLDFSSVYSLRLKR